VGSSDLDEAVLRAETGGMSAFFGCCEMDRPERITEAADRPRRRSAALAGTAKAGIGVVFHADLVARQFRVAAIIAGPAKASGQVR
jgi:hypothetical protein